MINYVDALKNKNPIVPFLGKIYKQHFTFIDIFYQAVCFDFFFLVCVQHTFSFQDIKWIKKYMLVVKQPIVNQSTY